MTLSLENVTTVVGGETHIHPVTLTLEKGSLNVLLGPTLSGKTSLMRLMAGLDKPTAGRVLWDGEDVTGVPVQKRNVAMVYQQFINYPAMSVYENIASPLRIEGLDDAKIDRKVREAAELMKLTPMLDRKPLELSGGQQQRTALARAVVKGADLVVLDEPLANLDYKLREELRAEIPRIFAESGAVFVYATTEPTEALLLGGHTAALWEGRMTQFGETLDVYRNPQDVTTARVFSDPPMNFVSVAKAGSKLLFGEGQTAAATGKLANLPDGRILAGFRPDHLKLQRPSDDALAFQVEVAVSEITGSESFIHVIHGADRWVALTHGVHEPELGSKMELYVNPHQLYIFDEDEKLIFAPEYAEAA
ncbi:ABC transporter ATP-binding protein [Terasakiella sp. A23]|uniref:ABC transporter ATP-binding protein n=1 Tax=Terasakiella sp. FCG-A23 TaxID=3080561 RepID=UPI0029531A6C|nr:ABC transporter ATP-binding protein [Terasakiella sp. A23]MDV7341078.1 ABC transporter ATP-binding protein [Terasakiella sp. A23]